MSNSTDFARFALTSEKRIARALIEAIFSQPGRSVTVSNGVSPRTGLILNARGVYKHLATTGNDWIVVYEGGEKIGAVWLVWGNGDDLVSDYTIGERLVAIVEPVLKTLGVFD